jgi:hypothetical protein
LVFGATFLMAVLFLFYLFWICFLD